MNRVGEIMLWAAATVAISGGTAWMVARSVRAEHAGVGEGDLHRWMHERLVLSEEQHAALEPFERAYEEKRRQLGGKVAEAGRKLAQEVRAGDPGSTGIESALSELNGAQAELQRATLEHFFAMKEHLDPEQAEKLLKWTHDSIVHE